MARILLIDDETDLRTTVRMMLEQAGYEVVEADNGLEGLRQFEATAPDIVITDLIMPDMEGIETIRKMKSLAPATPIIAMSGGGRARRVDFLKAAKVLGASRTLPKPFRRHELLAAVQACLGAPGPAC
ncbi:MAG: response regulator [Alphaproteobacteria bacterium]|nr:MAG: response regulator [Alphaproteobacteria bacterium]